VQNLALIFQPHSLFSRFETGQDTWNLKQTG